MAHLDLAVAVFVRPRALLVLGTAAHDEDLSNAAAVGGLDGQG